MLNKRGPNIDPCGTPNKISPRTKTSINFCSLLPIR